MAKQKDSDLLILGLLALAFLGKGPLAGPTDTPAPMRMGPMDMPSNKPMDMGDGSNGKTSDGAPSSSGTNDKNQSTSNKNMGMGGGVPDKGSPMTPPMGPATVSPMYTPSKDNAGVMAAERTIAVIAGGGNMMEGPNTFLNKGLPTIGGAGASTTTTVFNPKTGKYDTYTNNELLFSNNADTKNNNPMSAKEMAKQPMPAMMAPMMMMPIPLSGLVDTGPKTNVDIYKALLGAMATPAPAGPAGVQAPIPAPSGTLPNPLPPMPSILSSLQGFGQGFLNQFLQAGQSLTGLFNNLNNILPTIPGLAGPKPLPIEAV